MKRLYVLGRLLLALLLAGDVAGACGAPPCGGQECAGGGCAYCTNG